MGSRDIDVDFSGLTRDTSGKALLGRVVLSESTPKLRRSWQAGNAFRQFIFPEDFGEGGLPPGSHGF
jgi:hypothetical protein